MPFSVVDVGVWGRFFAYTLWGFLKFLITKFRELCDISVLVEDLHITYEAGPKLNEAKLKGRASLALGNIQYIHTVSSRALVWEFRGAAATSAPPAPTQTPQGLSSQDQPALTRTTTSSPAALLIYTTCMTWPCRLRSQGTCSRASSALAMR